MDRTYGMRLPMVETKRRRIPEGTEATKPGLIDINVVS